MNGVLTVDHRAEYGVNVIGVDGTDGIAWSSDWLGLSSDRPVITI